MVKKVLALAAIVLFATAGVAGAQQYPPAGNTITANDTTVAPGGSITLAARTYQSNATVTFTLFSAPVVLGTATANSSGVATLTATIPTSTPAGSHTIEATGTGANGQPLTVSMSITVTGAAAAAADLPVTGSSSTAPMTQLAIAAIAGGGLLVLTANRRRTTKLDTRETAGV